jgi:hypothetical protein
MKSLKHALLGLMLSTCAAFAFATPIVTDPIWVPADMDPSSTQQTFSFGEGGAGIHNGDVYIYDFWFNTPPPTAWFDFTVTPDMAGSLSFSNVGFSSAIDPTMIPSGTLAALSDSINGNFIVDSGLYSLQLTVSYLADGASFSGQAVSDLATVPEPMSLCLLGLGMAAMAGARRRKSASH